jgi:glutaredoxin
MDKKIKIFLAFVAGVVLVGGIAGYSILRKSPTMHPTTDIMFFYGRECPHCQEVEKFLTDNRIADKLKYDSGEVWHNQDNADLMLQKAQACGIAADQAGVPLVYDQSQNKCYMGTPDAEAFFEGKAGF